MACGCCAAKDRKIAELEKLLDGAVYPTREGSAHLAKDLGITPQQAELVETLFRSGARFLDKWTIDEALSRPKDRGDPDETMSNLVQVQILRIRKRLGRDFIQTQWGHGFRLSEAARARVSALLKAAA